MSDCLKLLRYNTGTDKKVLIKFKDKFSAVIFNATIVAYSKSAVADLVAVHKNQYIIDPQTHIYQQDIKNVQSVDKNGNIAVKKSVDKYLSELPLVLKTHFYQKGGNLSAKDINDAVDELVDKVYFFDSHYVDSYIKTKEYDKYLKFAKIGPSPAVVIAPYFMLKSTFSENEINEWLELNSLCAQRFIEKNADKYKSGIQIVMDKGVLSNSVIINKIKKCYEHISADYAFIWIDEFSLFDATPLQQKQFRLLLEALTEIGIKPVMAYGGYDAILLCNKDLPYRMYGVAQSVGYGEARAVTPVGGGLPVNKYYFYPLHLRMNLSEVTSILMRQGFFSMDPKEASDRFYNEICSCEQCKATIGQNIHMFDRFNESSDYLMRNGIRRNRPTNDASIIAAMHFLYSKTREWAAVEEKSFDVLTKELKDGYNKYLPAQVDKIASWYSTYEL
nr:hypothetical protein [Clostridia bacterium]